MKRIILLLITVMFWSCQKDQEPIPIVNTPSPCLVTKVSFSATPIFNVVEYNSEKKPIKIKFVSQEEVSSFYEFEYNKQGQISKQTNLYPDSPLFVTTHTYEYNNMGQLIRSVRKGGTPQQSEISYEYDQLGNRVKMIYKDTYTDSISTYTQAFEYTNGNLIKLIYNPGLATQRSVRYEYYLDQEDKRSLYPASFLSLGGPTRSKNMVKRSIAEWSNASTFYQYEYNLEGFPIKETSTYNNGNSTFTSLTMYEYSCQ